MKYELKVIDTATQETTSIIYETDGSTLEYLDGTPVELKNTETFKTPFKKKQIIQLGFACNFRCDYCVQAHTKKKTPKSEDVQAILDDLLKKDLSETRVEFWGGEPLLYYPTIIEMAKTLKDKVHSFLIITNGSLLTMDKLDELMSLNFTIAVSHDIQNQEKHRGLDPFKKNPEVFKKLFTMYPDRSSINSVMTEENYITKERVDWIKDVLGIEEFAMGGEGFVVDYGNTDNVKSFDVDVYRDLMLGEGLRNGYYTSLIDSFVNSIVYKKKLVDIQTKCGVGTDYYTIESSDRKELTCHNYMATFKVNYFKDRTDCHKCLVSHLCKGQCPALKEDTKAFKRNCEMNKKQFTAMLRVAIFRLTDYKYQVYDIKRLDI